MSGSKKKGRPKLENRIRYCSHCAKYYSSQAGNFPKSASKIWKANGNFISVCYPCVMEIFEGHVKKLKNYELAVRRMCMKFGVYYSDYIFEMAKKDKSMPLIKAYLSKAAALSQSRQNTFDHTLAEEDAQGEITIKDGSQTVSLASAVGLKKDDITPEQIMFWGMGFSAEEIYWLENRYKEWTSRNECNSMSMEELIKDICISNLLGQRALAKGETQEHRRYVDQVQKLMDSAKLQPKQDSTTSDMEQATMGTLIKMWENERPISEPEDEFKDPDKIVHHICVWFFGHACKMLKIKNKYSKMYEKEVEKYGVDLNEYYEDYFDDEESDSDIDTLLGDLDE